MKETKYLKNVGTLCPSPLAINPAIFKNTSSSAEVKPEDRNWKVIQNTQMTEHM